ncbi:MAG: hypothetical protein HRT56_05020 [Coraliomargarita sp.]|nr:hypothetical protein [Coraliomargarita sp.]
MLPKPANMTCQALGPIFESTAESVGRTAVTAQVNTDDHPQLARELGISSIPTLIDCSEGQLQHRHSGITQPAEILARIEAARPASV